MRLQGFSVLCVVLGTACGGGGASQPAVANASDPAIQPGPPVIQPQQAGGPDGSNFGEISLQAGFTPDPHVVQGQSGGQQQAGNLGPDCQGHISARPDHLLTLETPFDNLRIMAASERDTTLIVQTPQGVHLCNDDSEGRNPMVTGAFAAGTYRVWVGSYQAGDGAPYQLGVSELNSVTPSNLASGGTPSTPSEPGESNFGVVQLSAGFTPDPHAVSGRSGGAIQATNVGSSCRGWISATPDHIFMAQTNFSSLKIMARANEDVTLVIGDDAGNVWCDDDSGGDRNPMVQTSLNAGRYRVWVGSYQQGTTAPYQLGFSELSSVTPTNLPSP